MRVVVNKPSSNLTVGELKEFIKDLDDSLRVKILTTHSHNERRNIVESLIVNYERGELLLEDSYSEF